jgi:hypothetical protein
MKKESSSKKTIFPTNKFNWYKYKIYTHVYRRKSCCKINLVVLWQNFVGWKIWILSVILQWENNQMYKNSLYMGTSILLRNKNKSMSIQRKDKQIELSWQLKNSNRYQIERLVHISNTIIIIALFTKSLETMTSMYSSKIDDDNSHDKTTTSRARYSRNNSSDDDNLHTDH